ncbi:MAG TPA: protein kinase, partial [Aggregatilineales bacterium]|nr:protein kinase [Aggregatilineales bacterium]
MNTPPLTQRKPPAQDEAEARALIRKARPDDARDPFANDPNAEISRLGKLALRRKHPDTNFALGDLCALQTFQPDDARLLIFYAGKTLTAYRRAGELATDDDDRELARAAIYEFTRWLIEMALQYPSRRNLAVALWVIAEQDGPNAAAVTTVETVDQLLQAYHRRMQTAVSRKVDTGRFRDPQDVDDATIADMEYSEVYEDSLADIVEPDLTEGALSADSFLDRHATIVAAPEDIQTGPLHAQTPHDTAFDQHVTGTSGPIEETSLSPSRHLVDFHAGSGEFVAGDMIEGTYQVMDVRYGGMGVVYLCYDHDHREPVAIKSFQSRFLENERAVHRFINEALTWIRLDKHRNIVQARLVRTINDRPHIILEHISGPEGIGSDLRSWIDHRRLTLEKSVAFALHIALGMQHATQKVPGLVHRDLKPANIIVTHDGIAKVTD